MNILIAGGGSIGKRHLKNLQSLGYQNIWVLKRKADPEFEKDNSVSVLTSFEQGSLLKFDCIFVGTPTSLHNESLAFAASQNLHIFMEKPLIHNQPGLEASIALMKNYSRVFFIGFMLRFHPLVRKIKEILNEGNLGPVYSARFEFGSYLPFWHPWEDHKESYASRKELGGGVINTICHELDLIQYFFGLPDSLYTSARNLNKLGIPVEELCETIFEYPDKVVSLHLDYLQKDYDRNIKILCEEGKILWNWHSNELVVVPHKKEMQVISSPEDFEVNQLYLDEVRAFFKLIDAQKTSHSLNFDHARQNTELLLHMHESARIGQKLNYEARSGTF